MAKYSNMVRTRKKVSEGLTNLALQVINEMLEDGEVVSICTLTKRTGCSRDFFYKNKIVNEALRNAIEQQTGKVFISKQKVVLDRAMQEEIKLLKKQLQTVKAERDHYKKLYEEKNSNEFDYINNL